MPQARAGAGGPEGRGVRELGPWVMGRDEAEGRRHRGEWYQEVLEGRWEGSRQQAFAGGTEGMATAHSYPQSVGGPGFLLAATWLFQLWPLHASSIHVARGLEQGAR